ncbi:MAG: AraC family transcriptional regulator [Clostridium sp.]|nr:AraC family transcriptional regulator [Acetatifactor muris]MCM1525877.1 AraC family transcriptional regulator [Bacteroides sp.]MCM1562583.1 AraC family transcriptional regulator [Clostridium sp.]
MDPMMFDETPVQSDRILYTPSDFAKSNLIHLQEVGSLRAKQPHTSRRRNLSSYLFFMVSEGEGELEYEGRTYALGPGDCVFVDCHKTYAHSCKEPLWRLKWVHFYGPNMGGIYGKYVERGGRPVLHPRDADAFERILNEIYAIAASDTYIKDMQICEKLTSLLTLLMGQSWRGAEGAESGGGFRQATKKQNLQAVKEYLDAHYDEKITLDMLAGRFYINKFYLTRVFKEQFGESVTEYLLQARITQAKQRLRFTDKSIEEIAHECGMHDANYFARQFKKVEGVTAGQFRRMW